MSEPSPQHVPGARRRGFTLLALLGLTPVAAVAGGLALAPLSGLAGAVAACWPHSQRARWLAYALLAAIGWAALSIIWSPIQRPEQAIKIVLTAVSGISLAAAAGRLDETMHARGRLVLIAAALLTALLIGVEAISDFALNRLVQPEVSAPLLARNPGRGVLVLLPLGFGAIAAAQTLPRFWRFGLSVLLLALMAALSLQFDMGANALAYAFGALAFALSYAWPSLAPMIAGIAFAVWQLIAPWVILAFAAPLAAIKAAAPESWAMRLQIWDFAARRVAEKPFFGWGLDAARGFDQQQQLGALTFRAIPLHPHNVSLQIWLECGAIGAALFALVIGLAGYVAAKACRGQRAAGATAAASFAVLGLTWNLSYGAWQEWFMVLPFLAAIPMCLALKRVR